MVDAITLQATKADQCRLNAQSKSERKRQAVLDAILSLQQQGQPVTKTTVKQQAAVSYPFLAKHADLLQAIEAADNIRQARVPASATETRSKDVVHAAMQRQMDKLKQQVKEKEVQIRQQQRNIDVLYGKLSNNSVLTDAQLRAKLKEALARLHAYEDSVSNAVED